MAASTRVAPSTPEASLQKNTSAESALRRELHARGLRYRIQVPDGCPVHGDRVGARRGVSAAVGPRPTLESTTMRPSARRVRS
jgi:hypothetical protein